MPNPFASGHVHKSSQLPKAVGNWTSVGEISPPALGKMNTFPFASQLVNFKISHTLGIGSAALATATALAVPRQGDPSFVKEITDYPNIK